MQSPRGRSFIANEKKNLFLRDILFVQSCCSVRYNIVQQFFTFLQKKQVKKREEKKNRTCPFWSTICFLFASSRDITSTSTFTLNGWTGKKRINFAASECNKKDLSEFLQTSAVSRRHFTILLSFSSEQQLVLKNEVNKILWCDIVVTTQSSLVIEGNIRHTVHQLEFLSHNSLAKTSRARSKHEK